MSGILDPEQGLQRREQKLREQERRMAASQRRLAARASRLEVREERATEREDEIARVRLWLKKEMSRTREEYLRPVLLQREELEREIATVREGYLGPILLEKKRLEKRVDVITQELQHLETLSLDTLTEERRRLRVEVGKLKDQIGYLRAELRTLEVDRNIALYEQS